MQRRAFTLLETLISLGIVIVVLAGAVTFSRSFYVSGQVSEDRVQAESLADDAIGMLIAVQRTVRTAATRPSNLTDYFYVNRASDTAVSVIPYRTTDKILWCSRNASAYAPAACANHQSKVGPLALSAMFEDPTYPGELIAVNRAAWVGSTARSVTDATTTGGANVALGLSEYDYYVRSIKLEKTTLDGIIMHTANVTVTNTRTGTSITKTIALSDD